MFEFIKSIFGGSKPKVIDVKKINSGWFLKILDGKDRNKVFSLDYSIVFIGRIDKNRKDDRKCSIRLDDQSISFNQAHLVWKEDKLQYCLIHDKQPTINRTFVNDKNAEPGVEILLNEGDKIKAGRVEMVITREN